MKTGFLNTGSSQSFEAYEKLCELLESIIHQDLNRLIALIQQGADVNGYEDDSRVRPIHFAAQFFPSCVEYLLLAGADPYIKTQDGYNALDIEKLRGHEALFFFLESYPKSRFRKILN